MLFRSADLDGIKDGSIDLAFRRWKRPSVKPGTRLRTAIGLVEVLDVAGIDTDAITDDEARRAGASDRGALLARLEEIPAGVIYRITLRHAGSDPREALRTALPSNDEIALILDRLARLDTASHHGPWTATALALIAANESVRAADLAARLGRETLPFKTDVRKLKEMGLTESLEVGYRLSACGRAILKALDRA